MIHMLREDLKKAIRENTVSHAYLFDSDEEAAEFAKAFVVHPVDLIEIAAPEGKMHILSDDIEKLRDELKYKSYGERRVVLIHGADSMQQAPQNKLLKTLEEPLGNTVIILSAERREALLPTILSRCVIIAESDTELLYSEEALNAAKAFWALKKKDAAFFELKGVIKPVLDDKDNARERSLEFLDALEDILREELISTLDSRNLSGAIKLTEETRNCIRASQSVAICMKALALNI